MVKDSNRLQLVELGDLCYKLEYAHTDHHLTRLAEELRDQLLYEAERSPDVI